MARFLVSSLALLCLLLAAASEAAASTQGGPVESGKATISLDGGLMRRLAAEGIRFAGSAPARVHGRTATMPIAEGMLETSGGTGYVFPQGSLRFVAGRRSVKLRKLVLNTAKRRLGARIGGKRVVLATVGEVKAEETIFGVRIAAGGLRFARSGAAALDRGLGLPRAFAAGAFGTASISAEMETVPVGEGTLEFSFDEGFRQKLQSLGIAVSPFESATLVSSVPLAYSFANVGGSLNRQLSHGSIGSGENGLRLVQGEVPNTREVALYGIGANFESKNVSAGWSIHPPGNAFGSPLGQADFAGAVRIDAGAGTVTASPTPVMLSSYAVAPLNEAFAAGESQQFFAGEPLGTVAFTAHLLK